MINMKETDIGEWVKAGRRHRLTYVEMTRTDAEAQAVADGYALDPLDGLTVAKLRKKKAMAAARYDQEMGGFQLPPGQGGMFVRTDARNRTLLNAAALRASADPAYEVPNWKTNEGTFITLSNSMILTLNGAVEQFIAAQFAKEAALSAQIDSATTPEEVNAITW